MVGCTSAMTLFPYLLNVVDGASAMTLFPYLLNVMGSGGWCQYYDIVSLPAECDA